MPTFSVGYLVQSMAVLVKDAVFETHIITSGTNASRDQALKTTEGQELQNSRIFILPKYLAPEFLSLLSVYAPVPTYSAE